MKTKLTLEQRKKLYLKAKKAYYNHDSEIMSDAEFDRLENLIKKEDPSWPELAKTGVKVNKKTEAPLLKFMPSLNKKYPHEVPKYFSRREIGQTYVMMSKLDGCSLQLVYENKVPTRLFTRGDGELGGEISFFIPWLLRLGKIPRRIRTSAEQVVIRLEGIMTSRTFRGKWSREAKGDEGRDNARQLVNGVFNRKTEHPALADIDLVALGLYDHKINSGLLLLEDWGFNVVEHCLFCPSNKDTAEVLTAQLARSIEKSKYLIDGLVLAPSGMMYSYKNADKPKDIIAFKFNDEEGAAEVLVEEVIWQKTRLKRWQPKIKIPPTYIDGVTVTYVTAHNPALMKELGIGPGAVVKVLRSGGVIPKIVGVVKKAKFQPPPGAYELRGRFFYMLEHDKTTEVRQIHHFFTSLGIELLAMKSIERMYDAGYTSPLSYMTFVHRDKDRPAAVAWHFRNAGFGQVDSAKKANELIRAFTTKVELKKLMVASGCFENGIGERKLSQLQDAGVSMSKLLVLFEGRELHQLEQVKGFSTKTVAALKKGLASFTKLLAKFEKYVLIVDPKPAKTKAKKGKLEGLMVTWTGYRSPEQEDAVVNNGGQVVSFSSKTQILLYKKGGKASTKIEKAGDKAMTWEQFAKKYSIKD